MLLKSIRKSKRIISSFLVINLITELIFLLNAFIQIKFITRVLK